MKFSISVVFFAHLNNLISIGALILHGTCPKFDNFDGLPSEIETYDVIGLIKFDDFDQPNIFVTPFKNCFKFEFKFMVDPPRKYQMNFLCFEKKRKHDVYYKNKIMFEMNILETGRAANVTMIMQNGSESSTGIDINYNFINTQFFTPKMSSGFLVVWGCIQEEFSKTNNAAWFLWKTFNKKMLSKPDITTDVVFHSLFSYFDGYEEKQFHGKASQIQEFQQTGLTCFSECPAISSWNMENYIQGEYIEIGITYTSMLFLGLIGVAIVMVFVKFYVKLCNAKVRKSNRVEPSSEANNSL